MGEDDVTVEKRADSTGVDQSGRRVVAVSCCGVAGDDAGEDLSVAGSVAS